MGGQLGRDTLMLKKKKPTKFRRNLEEFGTKVHQVKPKYDRKKSKQELEKELQEDDIQS